MSFKKFTVSEWIEKYKSGYFNNPSIRIQLDAGWSDWFCKDSSLPRKTTELGHRILQIAESPKINKETMCIFLRNNSPVSGSLYDEFCFADIKTENIIYCIVPYSGISYKKGVSEVWGKENEFNEPLVSETWKDVKKFFEIKH